LHTNAINRHCLTRLIAAGAVAAVLFLGGCATDGSSEKGWHPFAKSAAAGRDEAASQQAQSDSFPTAKQAGL